MSKGLIHVYTGDGKGKTTAALGLALRAIGWGKRVCMIQFIKGYPEIGEAKFALTIPDQLVVRQFAVDTSRSIDENKVAERREAAEKAMKFARSAIASGDYELVILDEINNAMHYGLVDAQCVLEMLASRPDGVEVALTGRNAPPEIMAAADYVTEMRLVKHPYENGVQARRGVDY